MGLLFEWQGEDWRERCQAARATKLNTAATQASQNNAIQVKRAEVSFRPSESFSAIGAIYFSFAKTSFTAVKFGNSLGEGVCSLY